MTQWQEFLKRGWTRFDHDSALAEWAAYARPLAQKAAQDPIHAEWLDCEGTWFIGVDALDNDLRGTLPGGPALRGAPLDFIAQHFGGIADLHKAQVSVVYPGYPRPRFGENEAAFRYRSRRDAAHVDGVKMFGTTRNRRVEEPHAWVLGIPLNPSPAEAAPLVIWEGSHEVMRRGFAAAFHGHAPETWHQVDVTEAYKTARAEVFETCAKVAVHARPGEAYLMHRLCLHGVAAWEKTPGADATGQGRAIAYFRPDLIGGVSAWINEA
ncbi:hypothetical protein [Pseudophaeobacter sp. EL27]|uniref:hypothetical protein n=1 Tax=Pseudophaeobacter sp. EL27 TaxID=2107580 RepID=UPI000EFAFDFC|nr:hypothetical protein [Pseudophaeobacter sp. EL27]